MFFNWNVRIIAPDRTWYGVLLAVDKHMNVVLHQAEEVRSYKIKGVKELKEVKRGVGLVVLRGTEIMSVIPERHSGSNYVYVKTGINVKKKKNQENQPAQRKERAHDRRA